MWDALVGSATDARPLLSRMIKRFAVAEDVAPWTLVALACLSAYPFVAASAAALGVANCARPAESRITRRFAVADDVAPWMPLVASMWLLAAASVVAGASYQLVAPVIARMRCAIQLRICRRDPEFPLGTCVGSRVRLPLSIV